LAVAPCLSQPNAKSGGWRGVSRKHAATRILKSLALLSAKSIAEQYVYL
jgi:hypothetical protein